MQILYAVTLHFTRKINTSVINVINARSIHIHRCLKSSSNEAHSFSPRNMGLTVAFSDVFLSSGGYGEFIAFFIQTVKVKVTLWAVMSQR